MSAFIPPFINKGACFSLVAPAGKIEPEVVPRAESYLRHEGFKTRLGKYTSDEHYQFSATDDKRVADMQQMIDDPDVDVIWCCRGGYGSIRIIEKLNFSPMQQNPKWLVGFSDITVFHAALQNVFNVASIHGPMPVNLHYDNEGAEWQHFFDLLEGREMVYRIPPSDLNIGGTAAGQLTGGNLSLLCALIGTKYDFDPRGKILFIEETGEQLYHIDRMMHHLKLSGKLEGLAGLVTGHLTGIKDKITPFGLSARGVIQEAVKNYNYPVLFDFPAGHESPNEPLILGHEIHLQVDQKGGILLYK